MLKQSFFFILQTKADVKKKKKDRGDEKETKRRTTIKGLRNVIFFFLKFQMKGNKTIKNLTKKKAESKRNE